ncbi:multidrug effflux MFS transporter [Staphylococcus hominis]|uniref:multidrug effflux MFS transporter n=1 Tax=Staphylococcus hominis TaxID=1290 RepID=UPI001F5911C0|nr:multidrug effflux MFS transporter [Staphylococcus hominis]MCI2872381.1 multidrug effflux MFS transporter [Staphylococcus hominis]MCI2876645.1 multidrug effflux MFS transporter [Staphylococcus hominis]MCI2891779.1 multidrug effflux MFS transporter [Staphylococcus hominis]MDS3868740.1 multidrug effflux MFS transporter [Staphylococcus hominis]
MHNSTHTKLPMLLLIVLGTMTAFGPMIIDMYLPALPAVQQQFHTSTSSIQLTLSFAMIGLALGQFIFGPLSDVFGRKKIALIILSVFVLASCGAIFITTFPTFLLIRLVQGLTAGGIIVIAKAFAGDYYQGNTLAKFLASLMVVNGIVTILMPLLGGLSLSLGSWRMIFVILTAISMIMLGGVTFNMPTTHHSEHVTSNFKHIFSDFGRLLKRPRFIIPMFLQGLTYVMLFSFSSASPFITQKIYHMTPQQFSVMIAINGIGLIVVSQIIALLVERIHRFKILIYLTFIQLIGVLLIVFTLILQGPLWLLLVAFFLNVCPVTSIGPLGFSMAMEERTGGSGNASSLLGLFQFILGGLVSPLVGLKGQYNVVPYITVIIITAILIVLLQFLYFKKYQRI